MKLRLTEALIKKLRSQPEHRTAHDYFDSDVLGLCITIRPSGAASFCLRYRRDGLQRRLTLGKFPGVGVEAARKAARKFLGEIAEGADPAAEKQARRHRDTSAETYPAMVETFIRRHGMIKNRGWREQARVLGLRLSPISARQLADPRPGDPPAVFTPIAGSLATRWARKLVREITRAEVAAAVDELMPAFPAAANHRLSHLKSFFSWLTANGFIDSHPCDVIPPPATPVARDRVLSDDEIKGLWASTETMQAPYRQYVRVLALTAQRRSEVATMEWTEIAGDTWIIPGSKAKNGDEHSVQLSTLVLAELQSLPRRGRFVFTSDKNGETSISCFADIKADVDAGMGAVQPWTLHDLRRTGASGMGALGVQPHVIEAVLNHRSGVISGIARVYQRHPYGAEKRAALNAWADHVARVLSRDEPKAAAPETNVVRAFATA